MYTYTISLGIIIPRLIGLPIERNDRLFFKNQSRDLLYPILFSLQTIQELEKVMMEPDLITENDNLIDLFFKLFFVTGFFSATDNDCFIFPNEEVKINIASFFASYYITEGFLIKDTIHLKNFRKNLKTFYSITNHDRLILKICF